MQGGARTTERERERERGACARAVTCITWRTCTAFVPRRVEISGVWFGDDWWGRGSKWSAALRAPRLTWPASPLEYRGPLSSTFSSPLTLAPLSGNSMIFFFPAEFLFDTIGLFFFFLLIRKERILRALRGTCLYLRKVYESTTIVSNSIRKY